MPSQFFRPSSPRSDASTAENRIEVVLVRRLSLRVQQRGLYSTASHAPSPARDLERGDGIKNAVSLPCKRRYVPRPSSKGAPVLRERTGWTPCVNARFASVESLASARGLAFHAPTY